MENADAEKAKPEHQRKRGRPRKRDGQKTYSVYALIKGRKIRYIGITSQTLSRRMCQHLQDTKRSHRREHKTNWLRKCKSDGIAVSIMSIRGGIDLESAQRIERQIIKKLRPQLVNVHDGGSSGYNGLPPEAKKRHNENTRKATSGFDRTAIAAKVAATKSTPEYKAAHPKKKSNRPAVGLLLHTIRVTDELEQSSFEVKIRQSKRLNQVTAETFGRISKPIGMDKIMRRLRQRCVKHWAHE